MIGLFISTEVLQSLSPELRAELLGHIQAVPTALPEGQELAESIEEDDDLPEISTAQAKKLISGCSEKTRKLLEVIARNKTTKFPYSTITKAMDCDHGELKGPWGGITRRARSILGNPEANLIWWDFDDEHGEHVGRISDMTHRSLRKAFGI